MFKTMMTAALISLLSASPAGTGLKAADSYVPVQETVTEKENSVEYQEIFDEATAGIIGCDYTATQMIEKQIVNGTNYIFIAKSTSVSASPKTVTVQITVHESLDGEISIYEIRQF